MHVSTLCCQSAHITQRTEIISHTSHPMTVKKHIWIGSGGNFTVWLAREKSIYEFLDAFSFSFESKYCDESTDTNTNTNLNIHEHNKLTELLNDNSE